MLASSKTEQSVYDSCLPSCLGPASSKDGIASERTPSPALSIVQREDWSSLEIRGSRRVPEPKVWGCLVAKEAIEVISHTALSAGSRQKMISHT